MDTATGEREALTPAELKDAFYGFSEFGANFNADAVIREFDLTKPEGQDLKDMERFATIGLVQTLRNKMGGETAYKKLLDHIKTKQ